MRVTVYGETGMRYVDIGRHIMFSPQTDPKIDFKRVDAVSLGMLTTAREIAEVPFIISSTYRTPKHSVEVGGSISDAHTEIPCTAFDIACSDSLSRFLIIKGLIAAGFRRIGIKSNHIHVDHSNRDQNVMWLE